jgi:dGTPase
MDWADDVAYSVHDVEDFFQAGLIPIDRMVVDRAERERFYAVTERRLSDGHLIKRFGFQRLRDTFDKVAEAFPINEPYRDELRQRSVLRSWTAGLVGRYIQAITLVDPTKNAEQKTVQIAENEEIEVAMLKQLTWYYVIDNPSLDTQQYGQRRVIRDLFNIYNEESQGRGDRRIFPKHVQEQLEASRIEPERIRTITDVIAAMTEQQVLDIHHRLTGISFGSVLDAIGP